LNETKENANKVSRLKTKVQELSNKKLLKEWKIIREVNKSCLVNDFTCCSLCYNKNNCILHLKYEEALTEELLDRGLLTFAFNIHEDEMIKENNSILDLLSLIKSNRINIPS
jgi:hypothetical protein